MNREFEEDKYIWFKYIFKFDTGLVKKFNVRLHERNLDLIPEKRKKFPNWTLLDYCRCCNCPLDGDEHPFCPVAINLVDLIEFFKHSMSYETVEVSIETRERHYRQMTSLQQGISSLLGIYMVTSGCPVLEKLKPMVQFHLPFATPKETTYRAASMYLTAQYLKAAKGMKPDWELKGLVHIYDQIQLVNMGIADRIRRINIEDASLNAVAILDCFVNLVRMSINYETLADIAESFTPLLTDETVE